MTEPNKIHFVDVRAINNTVHQIRTSLEGPVFLLSGTDTEATEDLAKRIEAALIATMALTTEEIQIINSAHLQAVVVGKDQVIRQLQAEVSTLKTELNRHKERFQHILNVAEAMAET